MSLKRDTNGHYTTSGTVNETHVLEAAEDILRRRYKRQGKLTCPSDVSDFLRMRLVRLPHEEFHAVWLDNRHRVIEVEKLFTGTVDGASVHPRETVRQALTHNASAVIFAHNHPSGVAEPSEADRAITEELRRALSLVGVRLLDHFVIGEGAPVSMAQRGLI